MAHEYGAEAGKILCDRFVPDSEGDHPSEAWREHLWVRFQVLLAGLSDLLDNFNAASTSQGHTLDTNRLLKNTTKEQPIKSKTDDRRLSDSQLEELRNLVERIAALEDSLSSRHEVPHSPQPVPELRLRPPL